MRACPISKATIRLYPVHLRGEEKSRGALLLANPRAADISNPSLNIFAPGPEFVMVMSGRTSSPMAEPDAFAGRAAKKYNK